MKYIGDCMYGELITHFIHKDYNSNYTTELYYNKYSNKLIVSSDWCNYDV